MSEFSSAFEKKILQTLNRMAERIAEDAITNASTKGLPSVIGDAIDVGSAKSSGNGVFTVSVRVDLDIAPMAAAYEFGSGEHATRGEAQDYPIVAKNAPALAFLWKYTPTSRKQEPYDEFVKFKKVMHPGVAARPYLTPALKSNVDLVKAQLSRSFGDAFKDVTPKIILIKAK